jgi:hypothetical protein
MSTGFWEHTLNRAQHMILVKLLATRKRWQHN